MAIEGTDFGGGHSPREFDPSTRTFADDRSPVTSEPRYGLALRRRVSEVFGRGSTTTNFLRAALGAGVLLFGGRLMSASKARRSARWPARLWPRY
jgi:hypothetical protein